MAKPHLLRLLIAAVATASLLLSSTAESGGELNLTPVSTPSTCQGSIAECMAEGGGEFEMDSESNRRILASKRYINYDALERNNVPCSRRGGSSHNCQPAAKANPYTRSCSAATRCRS